MFMKIVKKTGLLGLCVAAGVIFMIGMILPGEVWAASGLVAEKGSGGTMLAEGCFFDEGIGKLTIAEDFGWDRIIRLSKEMDWEEIEGLETEEVITAEIDLTGTNIFLEMESAMYGHHICFRDFINLETIFFTGSIDTKLKVDLYGMFDGCSRLKNCDFSGFSGACVQGMENMFRDCSSLISLDLSSFNTSNLKFIENMFRGCSSLTSLNLSRFNTSNVANMNWMFSGCSSLTSLDLSNIDTSNVKKMGGMFAGCSSLTSLDLSNFDTTNVENMAYMFSGCSSLTSLNLRNFNTINVVFIEGMFRGCSSLTNLDLSSFNTLNVIDDFGMRGMFSDCTSLISLNLSSFDTSNVKNMSWMFSGCSSLASLNLNNFDTSNVTSISAMFNNCSSLKEIDISSFDFGKIEVNDYRRLSLFYRTDNLEQIKVAANLPYAIILPDSSTIPDNMESYWVNTSGKECSEIQAGLSVPMTYSRRLRTVTNPSAKYLAKGKTFTDSKTNCKFKVTSSPAENPTVAFAGVTKKSKKITIPSVVTYQGITCQVTSVSAKALKGNTKIKSLIIGSNITRIEKKAFEGCKNLKKITVETEKLNFVGKNALKGIHKKCRIKVPSSNLKTYRKLFRKKGQKSTVKITK